MKTTIIAVLSIIVLGAGTYALFGDRFSNNDSVGGMLNQPSGEPDVTIVRTNQGYEPSEVTVKKGDIILWTNESDTYHWPASDLHPTHGVYPEFDPLEAIGPGEEWKFQFNEAGEWKFHDHLRANKVGTITVTQ